MARRIRWQLVVAATSSLLVMVLLSGLALSTTAVEQPLPGGTYVEFVPGAPRQINPLLNDPLSDPAGRDLAALLFDGLTRIGVDGLPEAALAENWQVDPSGEVYIFQLRRDVRWHDGEPFTASDVIFTIRAIQERGFSGDPALANLWRNVLVDRIDNYTVRFTLSAPYAPFPGAALLPMLPEHILGDIPIDEWAESDFAQEPVGTGPYRLTELTGDRAVLAANDDYFRRQPFVQNVELRFVDSPQAALPRLIDGQALALGASTTLAPELAQASLPETLRRVSLPLDAYVVLTFNLRRSPLDELVLRQALARGLNKSTLVEEVLDGQVARINTPILPGWWSYDPTVEWYDYDPQAAGEALDALGYEREADDELRERNGRTFSLPLITDSDPGRLQAAEELARQWGELGIEVEITELEPAELRERLREHNFVLALHGWARLGADPDVFELWHSSQADDGLNYAGLRDDTIDELLTNARIERDLAARNAAYSGFQQRWVELVPSITLYQSLYTFVVSNEVDGIGFDQADIASGSMLFGREDRYRNVTRWFINSSREIRPTLR